MAMADDGAAGTCVDGACVDGVCVAQLVGGKAGGRGDTRYRIQVRGRLDPGWAAWLGGLAMTAQGGDTILSGALADQSALHGVLSRINDLNLTLVRVEMIEK